MTRKKILILAAVCAVPIIFLGSYLIVAKFNLLENFNETREEKIEAVRSIILHKYNANEKKLKITVFDEYKRHLSGVYFLGGSNPGDAKIFFAVKTKDGWELAFDDTGAVPCSKLDEYNFPAEMKNSYCFSTEIDSKEISDMIAIQNEISERYERTLGEIAFLITKKEGIHLAGKFVIENQANNLPEKFFATKVDGEWIISDPIYGSLIACRDLDNFMFPQEFKELCTPEELAEKSESAKFGVPTSIELREAEVTEETE